MEIKLHTDPLTGETFIPKKISQRFSCPANRIKYNNLKASQLKQERAFLDKHIHKNHLILREIYVDNETNLFDKMWLKGKGLRFDATNHLHHYKGKYHNCVYEYILIEIAETNSIKIIKI